MNRKPASSKPTCRFMRCLAAGLLLSLSTTAPGLAANIDLGLAGNYTIFGLGSSVGVGSADTLTGNTAEIYGDVAVGADTTSANAIGNATLQKGFIQGSLYVDGPVTPASYTIVNKNFTVSGTVFGTTPANPGRHRSFGFLCRGGRPDCSWQRQSQLRQSDPQRWKLFRH